MASNNSIETTNDRSKERELSKEDVT